MARDVLTISLSTVASESAFSVDGRVLDAYRSSLNPKTVEAVICLRDWVFDQALMPVEEMNADDLCGDVIKLNPNDGDDGEVTSKFSSGSGSTPKSGVSNC